MMISPLGSERVKQLAAIYQIKDLSKFSLVITFVGRPKMIKDN